MIIELDMGILATTAYTSGVEKGEGSALSACDPSLKEGRHRKGKTMISAFER